jgi:hypothetical protein
VLLLERSGHVVGSDSSSLLDNNSSIGGYASSCVELFYARGSLVGHGFNRRAFDAQRGCFRLQCGVAGRKSESVDLP